MYETLKVFDCQEMPPDIRTCFFEEAGVEMNDIFVHWEVGLLGGYRYEVNQWLELNGAVSGETVLIHHWW